MREVSGPESSKEDESGVEGVSTGSKVKEVILCGYTRRFKSRDLFRLKGGYQVTEVLIWTWSGWVVEMPATRRVLTGS